MDNIISINNILFGYQEDKDVFRNFSLDIPKGVTAFLGQNGTGKSTLMLLAAGRIIPEEGEIILDGKNTKNITSEEELNSIASVVYQNMEFDTEENIGDLLDFVFKNGQLNKSENRDLKSEIVKVLDLEKSLEKKTNTASKGEMQRVIIAFSLLYGSPVIFMDEPVFALENHQKDNVFKYVTEYAHKHSINIIYSIHDLDISRKFCDNIVLFYKDGTAKVGPKEEMLKNEVLEDAYQVPMHLLYEREKLNRETLQKRELTEGQVQGKILE